MKFSLNQLLLIAGLLMLGIAVYQSWERLEIKYVHLSAREPGEIKKILIGEKEVFEVKVLGDSSKNCWFENNYDIAVYSDKRFLSRTSHLRTLTIQDQIPSDFRLVVPASTVTEFPSATYPIRTTYKIKKRTISFSMWNLPVANTPKLEKYSSKPPKNISSGACCVAGKNNNTTRHDCLPLSENCSAAPAFRGYTHFDWRQWFDLIEFRIIPGIDYPGNLSKGFLSYKVILKLINKKLKNATVTFRDVEGKGWQGIKLVAMPQGFSRFFRVHRATYERLKKGEVLEFIFEFIVEEPSLGLSEIQKLIQIETVQNELAYSQLEVDGNYKIERREESKLIFTFDFPLSPTPFSLNVSN